MTIWQLMRWKESGSAHKSDSEVIQLVHDILQASDFNIDDLRKFDASRETRQMDAAQKEIPLKNPFRIDRWQRMTIEISVPTREKNNKGNGRTFPVKGFHYRPITDVVHVVFPKALSKMFHLTPFKKLWKSPMTGREQCVYDEVYTSDAWIQAQDKIVKQRRDVGCKLERVVAGLMFWSDST